MAIKVHFDSAGAPLPLRLILATKAGNRIRELPINAVKFKDDLMSGTEINFEVHKERCVNRDGIVDESFWRRITDFKLAYCPEIDRWYELHVEINERDDTMKAVQAISLGEAELSQINLYGVEINTEDDIARDDYEPTVLYNASNPDASLLDRMIKKAPHYRIAHVDESIADIQRTFQFDDKTIYDAAQEVSEEIGCLFRFDCVRANDGKIDRTINVYDLENYCTSCGYRGDFTSQCEKCGSTAIREGYGKNTSVFVSRENLADDVVYTTDTDSVKNCFRLEAGDDLMTATVINCNPNGTQYLWYVSDEMMEDMSDALRSRIAAYNTLYDSYQNTDSFTPDSNLLSRYNTIVSKYSSMNPDLETITSPIVGYPALMNALYDTIDLQLYLNSGLMPSAEIASTDAAREAAKLTVANLSPAAVAKLSSCTKETAANAVLGMAKCLVRGSFQVKVSASSYNASTHKWTGNFEVTNYSDETDTATSASVAITITDDMETYIKQKLDRAMKKESDDATDISAIFKLGRTDFIAELRKYSLQRLLSFRTACQAVLDILIQQGVGDKESWASQANDLYTNLYLPYRQKAADIEAEIAVRTNEIAVVAGVYDQNGGVVTNGMQSVLDARRTQIKEALDFESYLGEELWLEFASFRREDTYSNTNYISDGLDNAQLFSLAREFVATAQKEIYRSATMQHSIRSELKNLLSMAEFSPIVNDFAVGNWIRVKVDGSVYRLRLSAYELDYDSWALGSVTFTDVKYGHSSASDISSLLDAIRSMQTSYGAVMRQAEQGQKTYSRMNNWASEGFSLTTKIVGGAENQEFVMDETGFTGRELIPETDEYSDEQIKIIANGIYVTDDGWETVRAGLGKFVFWNPETQQYETRFGVIADTVVSPIILSQNVGVYNQSGDVKIDENGITIIADESNNETVFQILRRGQGGSLTNLLSIDGNGNLILSTYAQKSDTVKDVEVQYAVGDDSSTAPSTGWSSDTPQWTSGKYVWQRTKIIDGNDGVSYSDPVCIQGASGSQGVGISSVAEYYAVSSSNSTAPGDSSFDTAVPTMDTTNRYLWTYELITYTNGSTSRTAKRVIGAHGQNGINGRGVQSVTEYYATSSSNSTAPADSAFTTEVPTMDATNKYLWNYELTTYTDSNTTRTDKRVIGVFGEDGDNGVSITGVTNHYLATSASSGVTRSTSGWTTTVQTIDATNKYLWNYETITYSSGNPTYTNPTIIGTYGRDGTDGNDGVGISSITEYYARNNSSSSAPADNAFGTNMQAPDASNKYLWNRELITYTNNSTAWTSKRVIGMYSADGAAGKGISAITNYYLASSASSGVTRSTSGWTTNVQTTDASKPYLWNYEKIEYTSGNPSYSDPAIIGMYSQNGTNGYNTAIVYLYKRSPSAVSVDWTNKLTYTFATNSLNSVPSGWYTSIPSGTDPVYMTAATATSQSATDDILYTEWAAPVMIARNGTDGEPGAAGVGVSSIVEYYAKNNSSSSAPVDGDFTTSVQTPDASNKYLWNRELITYSNSTTTWTSKRVIGMYSADGATGKGISNITEYYTTSTSATTKPVDSAFGTAVPTMDATNKYLWNYELVTYTDGTSEKTDKRVIGTFGKDGSNGNNGVNTATVFLYQRATSSSGLSKPNAALTYTFATGALSGSLGNWSQSIPTSNGNPCFVIQATAVGTGATDSIAASEWSAIKELVSDGTNGDDGVGITGVTNYYLATNASSGVTRSTSGWTTSVQTADAGKPYLWNYEKIEYTIGDPSYTDPAIIGMFSQNGTDGYNTAIVYLYKRSDSAVSIDWTNKLTYTFATNSLSAVPSGWYTSVPSGTAPVYMTAATANSRSATDDIQYTEWSSPVMIARNGTNGTNGNNGINTATVFLYQRAADSSGLSKPSSALTYTFATGVLSGSLGNWTQTIQENDGNPCYVIQATAVGTGATDSIAASEWSDIKELVTDGEDGKNTAIVNLYKRATPERLLSSNCVSIEDAGDGSIVRMLDVTVEPVQSGSGDPSPDNVRLISGWTGAEVTKAGKNLLNPNDCVDDMYIAVASEIFQYISGASVYYAFVKPNTTYSLSADKGDRTVVCSCNAIPAIGGKIKRTIINSGTFILPKTFTTAADETIIAIYVNRNAETKPTQIQLEPGSTSTAYEPYQGNTYSITFPSEAGTVYGGTLDVVNGKLTVDMVGALLNDPDKWTKLASGQTIDFMYDNRFANRKLFDNSYSGLVCSYLPVKSGASITARWRGADQYFFGLKSSSLTLEQVQSDAIAGNIFIVYPLAEPIVYDVAENDIRTFPGFNTFYADTGRITVQYQADPSKMQIPIDWTETLTYNFATNALSTIPDGWDEGVPSGSDPLYITSATVTSNGDTGDVVYTKWSTPSLISAGTYGVLEITRAEMQVMSDRITSSVENGNLKTIIEQHANGIVEQYNTEVVGRFDNINNSLDEANAIIDNLSKDVYSLQGEIVRGWIENPSWTGPNDPDENGEPHFLFGIAISESISVSENEQDKKEYNNESFSKIEENQTFGLYTASGWYIFINGIKAGWFNGTDGMLHVNKEVIDTGLDIGTDSRWSITTDGGFGLRYVG